MNAVVIRSREPMLIDTGMAKNRGAHREAAFGPVIPEHHERVDDIPWDVYEDGFNWFNRANHTWHELADPKKVEAEVDRLRALKPRVLVSGHGPVAHDRSEQLFRMIAAIPTLPPVDEPSQKDLEALMEGHAGDDGAATGDAPR